MITHQGYFTAKSSFVEKVSFSETNYIGESRTAATSKVELFVIIVNGWKPLTIITKSPTLDVAAVLYPPLIHRFDQSDIVMIGGDFSSRLSYQPDFIIEKHKELQYLPTDYEVDAIVSKRCNEITGNQFGKELIDLCIACSLRMLTWRTRYEFQGNFNYYGYIGSSTLDFVLVSEYTIANTTIVQYMSVADLCYLSDHKSLMLTVISTPQSKSKDTYLNMSKLFDRLEKFIWKENLKSNFTNELNRQSSNAFDNNSSKGKSDENVENIREKVECLFLLINSANYSAANEYYSSAVHHEQKNKKHRSY